MAEPVKNWTPSTWRSRPIKQVPDYPDAAALADGREPAQDLSAAGVRGRGPQPDGRARAGRRGQGFPASGRRLRGKLRRIPPGQHPRHLPRHSADGRRADLRGRAAGGQGRPHRRSVRQAALRGHRDPERRHAAVLSRRQHQQHRVRPQGPRARSRSAAAGLRPVGGDAQSAARLRHRRLCRSAQCPPLDARFHRRLALERTLSRAQPAHRRIARLHGGLRHHARIGAAIALDRFLHQPRGAVPGLRAGDDARRFHQRRLVLHLGAYGLDRRPHARLPTGPTSNIAAASRTRSA